MKAIILYNIIIVLCTTALYSQVTLTSNNNPSAGNTIMSVECDTSGITQGNSGSNQTWNFTSLVRRDSSLITYVTSSSTPYSAQFPTSNLASTNDNTSYNYFTTSSSNLLANGYAFPGTIISYSDPELFMQYPFTYNTAFNDIFSSIYNSGGTTTYRTGTINVTGDAWGTINLPIGSFTNALRVKYIISTKDSSNPGTPVVLIQNLTSYVWFVPGRKFPLFEIIYTTQIFNGVVIASAKVVNYNPNSTPIGIQQISSEVPDNFSLSQNYPNPFNPVTNIEFAISKAGFVQLIVYDVSGREIETLVNQKMEAGNFKVDWNANRYPSGVYFYKLIAGDFVETKKMVLVK